MEVHKQNLACTVRALGWLLKNVGGKRMEMFFTCPVPERIVAKRSKALENSVLKSSFEGRCHMGESLSKIFLNSRLDNAARPLSVYVLTNGRWENEEESNYSGVGDLIEDVVRIVRKSGKDVRWIGFQFIRFHSDELQSWDEVGRRRLEYLDKSLAGELEQKGIPASRGNIVNTRDFLGDVGEMLEGIVSAEVSS